MSLATQRPDITLSPLELFQQLPADIDHLVFLASNGEKHSRWSLLAWDPVQLLSSDGELVRLDGEIQEQSIGELFSTLLAEREVPSKQEIPFVGGAIGTVNYEYGYQLLELPQSPSPKPLLEWGIYDHALLYDHLDNVWWEVRRGQQAPFSLEGLQPSDVQQQSLNLRPSWDLKTYTDRFDQLKEHIRQGDCYQACLTFPFFGAGVAHPRELFSQLFVQHPSPMSAYIEQSDRQVMSLSPERFLHWDGTQLETKPIKGTRPRHNDPHVDKQLREDLFSNEKERAELAMITDLLRNDLARVSVPGSVEVLEERILQALPSVWHAHAKIVSQSKEGIGAWDILESLFPGGSISGCPKRRAVEILRDLEDHPRGIYTGCIGYISNDRQMDLNIAIRTLENTPERLQASFGGGIVYDSQAEKEYQECLDKAQPFLS